MNAMSKTIMPGGGIARRPLHFIILADCSGSMRADDGKKIQALNFAIAEMLQHLTAWERDQERCDVLVRAIAFATEPRWHIPQPTPVSRLRWMPLTGIVGGRTNMAPAFRMAASVLGNDQLERRAFSPVLLLITDGMPTDDPKDFDRGLDTLMGLRAGREAMRLAVAIGRDARSEALTRFIADPQQPVLLASSIDEIADKLKLVSRIVSQGSSAAQDEPDEGQPVNDFDVVV